MAGNTKKWLRKGHRWIGLVVGIQLLLWTLSGLYFSLVPIETVRGEDHIREPDPVNFAHTPLVSPQVAIAEVVAEGGLSVQVRAVHLRRVLGAAVYEIHYDLGGESQVVLADARSGSLLPPLSKLQAIELARRDFTLQANVLGTDYIDKLAPGAAYRGGSLPAWRVRFDDPDATEVYVSTELARVTARRNNSWRLYDFLWMLHIMDFQERDNFNGSLLQLFATLGVVLIGSGFLLWAITTTRFRLKQ